MAEIQGHSASTEEARVATSLDKFKHSYIFQYQVFDIPGVRGAYVVDFLVTSTVPLSTPVEVQGEFWHRGQMGSEDQFRLAMVEDHFRGEANPVVVLWGAELQTQEESDQIVRRKIGPA